MRRRYLDAVEHAIAAEAQAIVGDKQRARYDEVARLVVCLAEAQAFERGPTARTATVATFLERYPRHVAFRGALTTAARQSTVLVDPPAPRR